MEKNKVLIVDDISENIKTISEMIKDFDIDVKTANGGKEAIELIDSFKPDVILLDLMMPHIFYRKVIISDFWQTGII